MFPYGFSKHPLCCLSLLPLQSHCPSSPSQCPCLTTPVSWVPLHPALHGSFPLIGFCSHYRLDIRSSDLELWCTIRKKVQHLSFCVWVSALSITKNTFLKYSRNIQNVFAVMFPFCLRFLFIWVSSVFHFVNPAKGLSVLFMFSKNQLLDWFFVFLFVSISLFYVLILKA